MSTKKPPTHITIVVDRAYADDLRERLKTAGVSQQELGDEMGEKREVISRWLTRKHAPSLESVKKLELALWRILQRREAGTG